jgi:protein-disulfide isomerase
MFSSRIQCIVIVGALLLPAVAQHARRTSSHSSATSDTALRDKIVSFFNRSDGWQGLDTIQVKELGPPDASGLRKVVVHLAKGEQHADQTFYITEDGRRILLGNVENLSGDPWRDTRKKLDSAVAGYPTEGTANAPVTLVEFSDLECPYCKTANEVIQQLEAAEPGKLRVAYVTFPLTAIHPWAMEAAVAATCVAQQNRQNFWQFSQSVFDHQDEVNTLQGSNAAAVPGRLRDFALESGAKGQQYDSCVNSRLTREKVQSSIALGKSVGVDSTPTLYIDGRQLNGLPDLDPLRAKTILAAMVDHEAKIGPLFDADLFGAKVKTAQCGKCEPLPPPPTKH